MKVRVNFQKATTFSIVINEAILTIKLL
jgi:hypothetical protein